MRFEILDTSGGDSVDFEVLLGYFTGLRFLDKTMDFSTLAGTALFVHFFDGIACGLIAKKSARSHYPWVIGGLLFGVWALSLLLLLAIQGKGGKVRAE